MMEMMAFAIHGSDVEKIERGVAEEAPISVHLTE